MPWGKRVKICKLWTLPNMFWSHNWPLISSIHLPPQLDRLPSSCCRPDNSALVPSSACFLCLLYGFWLTLCWISYDLLSTMFSCCLSWNVSVHDPSFSFINRCHFVFINQINNGRPTWCLWNQMNQNARNVLNRRRWRENIFVLIHVVFCLSLTLWEYTHNAPQAVMVKVYGSPVRHEHMEQSSSFQLLVWSFSPSPSEILSVMRGCIRGLHLRSLACFQ